MNAEAIHKASDVYGIGRDLPLNVSGNLKPG